MHFESWIAGFVDGEGCFDILVQPKRIVCRLIIQVRADDVAVLRRIQSTTGFGSIHVRHSPSYKRKGYAPSAFWIVAKKQDCMSAVEFFTKYPLQAKKAADFSLWTEAVRAHARIDGRGGDNSEIYASVLELKQKMQEVRKYRDP